jgi:hypothetical protein
LKAPGTERLKHEYDELLTICFNFAIKFELRRYNMVCGEADGEESFVLCDGCEAG